MSTVSQPSWWCVEVLAVAFGDTVVDAALVDETTPAYVIGEGHAARVHVSGTGLPDAGGFALVRVEAGLPVLAVAPCMRSVVIDGGGRRMLDQGAGDEVRVIELEHSQTCWVEHQGVRFRVRLVEREVVRASKRRIDRAWLQALAGSAVLIATFLALLLNQPVTPTFDADEPHPRLARLLEPRQSEPEPEPEVASTPEHTGVRSPEGGAETPLVATTPELPEPRSRRSSHPRPRWAPPSPAQAVGQLGRNHDPVEAARHAGILGPLGNRPFVRERVFDPAIEDGEVWASAREIGPSWAGEALLTSTRNPGHGEGVLGWGSYGSVHRNVGGSWSGSRTDARTSFGEREARRSPIVQIRVGRLDVRGSMDEDLARRIVRAHGHELRRCYEQTVSAPDAAFDGTIELSVVDSRVGAVVIDSAFPRELTDCLRRSMRTWRFPPSASIGTQLLSFPLHMYR